MPLTLTDRQCRKVAAALRRGAADSFRIADALDRAGRTHFLIEVSDMGQFAKDWNQLKTIIRQKDDALDAQAAQLDAQARQIAALQNAAASLPAFDGDDQAALIELHQTATDNAPAAGSAPSAPAQATQPQPMPAQPIHTQATSAQPTPAQPNGPSPAPPQTAQSASSLNPKGVTIFTK